MRIDEESSHPGLCSEVAGGVTRNIVCLFREPDAGNLPVRFDEREQESFQKPQKTWAAKSFSFNGGKCPRRKFHKQVFAEPTKYCDRGAFRTRGAAVGRRSSTAQIVLRPS